MPITNLKKSKIFEGLNARSIKSQLVEMLFEMEHGIIENLDWELLDFYRMLERAYEKKHFPVRSDDEKTGL